MGESERQPSDASASPSGAALPSLFVVSLPRSLSGLSYAVSCHALGLSAPTWTSRGEILNTDRYRGAGVVGRRLKYLRRSDAPRVFTRLLGFLDQVVHTRGFAYKDVVHPFVAAEWLRGRDLPVLRIRRSVADVACAMLARGWLYPARRDKNAPDLEAALVDGLLEAEAALAATPAAEIDYDTLVADETTLPRALQQLYPGYALREFHYLNGEFASRRDAILLRRASEPYQRLAALEQERRAVRSRPS